MRTKRTSALLAAGALATFGSVVLVPAPTSSAVERAEFRSVTDPAPLGPFPRAAETTAIRPLESSFALHSMPGADQVIYLDFDGDELGGTVWGQAANGSLGHADGFSYDDSPDFNDAELAAIQSVWQEVAADFAAFEVDVTTEDPGYDGLHRLTTVDQKFGSKALITSDPEIRTKMDCGCSGKAYIGVYDTPSEHAYYQPAMVLPGALANDPHNIAQTVSHEIGHTLGLGHDGVTGGSGYYTGVSGGLWAPIMGASFYNPVSQWSKGEYGAANNQQDDYDVMRTHLLYPRADESGVLQGTLSYGHISTPSDYDLWTVPWGCDQPLHATASPTTARSNLDLQLTLLAPSGEALATANPPTARVSSSQATGLDPTVESTVTAGLTYQLRVDGVGFGSWADGGYSDYGSIGGYVLALDGCTSPGAVTAYDVKPKQVLAGLRLSWQPPAVDGGTAISGYQVIVDSRDPVLLGADERSYEVDGLTRGKEHTATVRAVNAAGAGTPTSRTHLIYRVAGPVTLSVTPKSKALLARWTMPAGVVRAPVTGFRVTLRSKPRAPRLAVLGPEARKWTFRGLDAQRRYRIVVRAMTGPTAGPAAKSTRARPLA